MAPLLAMFLWKNENHNIGIRKILEIDKSKLLFGGRVLFWFSPPETERGPVWFYPEEAQAQPCLLKTWATMLSPLKNQVPRWHDSPQLEPKGLLLASLGVAPVLMTQAGSESVPAFQSFTAIRTYVLMCLKHAVIAVWSGCQQQLREETWMVGTLVSTKRRGWARGRAQLWVLHLPPALLLLRSPLHVCDSWGMLSREAFSDSNGRKMGCTLRPCRLHSQPLTVPLIQQSLKLSGWSRYRCNVLHFPILLYAQYWSRACLPTGENCHLLLCV